MGLKYIDVRVSTMAAPGAIYELLRDGATWPTWSPLGSFELTRPGDDEPEGVGAIRVFRTGRVTSTERVAELVPDTRFSYELVSGLAIRDYRADVDLHTDDGVTTIHWHSSFRPKLPGSGWLYQWSLSRFIERCARGLAKAAAGRSLDQKITER
jgi:Polyketide cyclase / dehydrase and lipid transport